ncbi:MAG TPA: type II secretion system F family protein [Azospira sp.]|nr:type II secretion system F family protein [Azospira sp.]
MRFEITAYRQGEGVTSLQIDAANADEAGHAALRQGFEPVAVRQIGRWNLLRRKEAAFDLLLFSQELRSLLAAGLSLSESLGALSRNEPAGGKRRLLDALIRRLREGQSFSAVLREFPALFPPLYLALTAASEQTGDLGGALARFVDYRGRMDTVKKRVQSAAIYPALLLGVGTLVIVFLMTYVVPRFSRVYADLGGELPLMSRLLLQWGALVESHGLPILGALALAVAATLWLLRRRRVTAAGAWHRLLGWPPLAPLRLRFRAYALARFYRTLGLLLQGGIPVSTALGMAEELLDEEMRTALVLALADIRAGGALSTALQRAGLAPPVAADLLRIGEKTGDMGDKMIHIADFHDDETARWADWFMRLFEPLLMLVIGLFIAFVVVLLYMPIFELAGSVQ